MSALEFGEHIVPEETVGKPSPKACAVACSWCMLLKLGALFFVVSGAGVAITALFSVNTQCIPPENPSRLAGCTCYLDDSWSLADCPAWNLADPRTDDNTCACDIVYITIIKPYTDVVHANTCDLWWDPNKPDYDPRYFTLAKELGEKYKKTVWGKSKEPLLDFFSSVWV